MEVEIRFLAFPSFPADFLGPCHLPEHPVPQRYQTVNRTIVGETTRESAKNQ